MRQSVFRSRVQSPKTANSIRDIDVPTCLAEFLKAFIGDRTDGFLFRTKSGKPISQRHILRYGLDPILRGLKLKQAGKGFHAFRRFRTSHLLSEEPSAVGP